MSKLLGRVLLKVNGRLLKSKPGASIDLGGDVRNPVVGSSSLLGHTVSYKEATIDATLVLGAGDSLEDIRNLVDGTGEFICDTGQTYMVREVTNADTLKVTEGEGGNIPVKLFGHAAEEM